MVQKGMMPSKYIVITRPQKEGSEFKIKLEKNGFKVLLLPTIKIVKNEGSHDVKKALANLAKFDLVIFTSKNGVETFMQALAKFKIDISILKYKKIAAVGSTTASAIKSFGFKVGFVPSKFTTKRLGIEIPNIKGKNILLARSAIATPFLKYQLEKRGAQVTDIPIYKTAFLNRLNKRFESYLNHNQIAAITFTSPSTVESFLKTFKQYNRYLTIPIFAIGPVTAAAAKSKGFKKIYTSNKFTTDGLIAKLKQAI